MTEQSNLIAYVVEQVGVKNQLHSKKITKNLSKFDSAYHARANNFLGQYLNFLRSENQTLDYAIDCYLQMIADVNYETVQFVQTGEYTSKSFDEVNKRVYDNPAVMEYYMHGLLLSQFLWAHHYDVLLFFQKVISENRNRINHYLEVGGGHGLYISEAVKMIGDRSSYDLVDISKSSLRIAQKMISNNSVNYILSDIFKYSPESKYDFITMGEVLEHVEDPVSLLEKLHSLLDDNGKVFVTTPTNAPAIDHIYLFRNADDIRSVIDKAGFRVESEFCIYSEDVSPEKAEKFKVSMMYAGVLVKK